MTDQEKKAKLAAYLVSKGIFSPDEQETKIAQMAATYPAAKAAEEGLVLNGDYVTKTCGVKNGTPFTMNITPIDDNAIWAVGYITATKGDITKTIYTEPKSAKVSELTNN